MALLSKPSFGPRTAITYITVGALLDVWTAVWYFSFTRNAESTSSSHFWTLGLFLTGLTLLLIGFFLGPIGRSARKAELPPREATPAEVSIQKTAAAVPNPVVVGGMPLAQPAVPAGYVAPVAQR